MTAKMPEYEFTIPCCEDPDDGVSMRIVNHLVQDGQYTAMVSASEAHAGTVTIFYRPADLRKLRDEIDQILARCEDPESFALLGD